jgi:hypothetical protein
LIINLIIIIIFSFSSLCILIIFSFVALVSILVYSSFIIISCPLCCLSGLLTFAVFTSAILNAAFIIVSFLAGLILNAISSVTHCLSLHYHRLSSFIQLPIYILFEVDHHFLSEADLLLMELYPQASFLISLFIMHILSVTYLSDLSLLLAYFG